MPHEPRLTRDLRTLLATQRVAALGTLGDDGLPFVSMVPFALESRSAGLVIHVSGLAAHTRNLQAAPQVSLLVMQTEVAGEPVHALPRLHRTATSGPKIKASLPTSAVRVRINHYQVLQLGAYAAQHP